MLLERSYVTDLQHLPQIQHLAMSGFVLVVILSQRNFPGLALYTDLHTTDQHVEQESRGANALRPRSRVPTPYADCDRLTITSLENGGPQPGSPKRLGKSPPSELARGNF